jgi:hypothetical protein
MEARVAILNPLMRRRTWLLLAGAAGVGAGARYLSALFGDVDPVSVTAIETLVQQGVLVDRVLAGVRSNWGDASVTLDAAWVSPGGDWFDGAGAFNGPTPTISQVIAGTFVKVDVSKIDGDLYITGVNGVNAPTIDGAVVYGFWMDPTSAYARALPSQYTRPVIIKNNARGSSLVFTTSSAGATLRVDKVAGTLIPDIPMVAGGGSPADIVDMDLTSEAAIKKSIGTGNWAAPYAYDPSFGNINGLPYLRFAVTPANQRAIAWFKYFTPQTACYGRYCIFIEHDVSEGMTELGMKLPGLSGPEVSWRMEHGAVDPMNLDLYKFVDYRYSADSGAGYGVITPFKKILRAGQWYVIEQYVKNNTFTSGVGNADGIGKIWLNGTQVWESTGIQWNAKEASRFTFMHVNVYHGGMGFPKQNIHYRIAGVVVSSKYNGVPAQLIPSKKLSVISKLSSGVALHAVKGEVASQI